MSQSQEVQVGVSDARANLTEVIARVRLVGERILLTRREKTQAVLVSEGFYRQALEDRRTVAALRGRTPVEEQQAS
ncbi:type II toxin-antitoxin system prevent-host-death family antitoxin [Streptomyces sp. H27-H5]|uniref:type II toxin-antitoxin system prevent-host-death family antitoxin n=1 Tax=Streptomyces sp. H27-H5 TaxID=2996460 RepID=UPI00226DCAAD|nr:type II toxin-antitoxin system prevent-host-death family antitoxin [Streptomyces sp. H27-H5]MCY0957667.1 type II toxin-antitoxin system prevent-host-death family antitoxin [Streptomyces sp. H27-H5]